MKLLCVTSALYASSATSASGQQLWFDYVLDYPFANVYLFEVTGSYQRNTDRDDEWRSINVTPTFEWQSFTQLDLLFDLPIAFTVQRDDYNSFEVAPTAGVRYHVSQNRRVTSAITWKVQERIFRNMELGAWEFSNRMRLKADAKIAINGPNLFQNRIWWVIVDYEEFFVTDEQLDERYANRRRGRMGIGYRHNYRNRFEVIYTLQSSRDEIEGEFSEVNSVIQLRYKMFLNPSTPNQEPTGTVPAQP